MIIMSSKQLRGLNRHLRIFLVMAIMVALFVSVAPVMATCVNPCGKTYSGAVPGSMYQPVSGGVYKCYLGMKWQEFQQDWRDYKTCQGTTYCSQTGCATGFGFITVVVKTYPKYFWVPIQLGCNLR
jgi:hypothetical protein